MVPVGTARDDVVAIVLPGVPLVDDVEWDVVLERVEEEVVLAVVGSGAF